MEEDATPPPALTPPRFAEAVGQLGGNLRPDAGPAGADQPPATKRQGAKKLGPIAGAAAYVLAKVKAFASFLLPLLKLAKAGKILLTMGTMVISVWAYAQWFGTWFAVGFVVLIFVHEMGHVWAAYKMGIPVSAPIFIPFMGALILTKKFGNKLITQDAIIGIGGPALGTAGAIACAGIYMATGSLFFLGLAAVTFFMNLFNLTPIFPLDGGWIVRAISPILWIVGLLILGGMVVTGRVTNPLIFVLIIMGLPTMWTEFRAMLKKAPSPVPAQFRWTMGAAYVGLVAVCTVGMSVCFRQMQVANLHRTAPGPAVSSGSPVTLYRHA